MRRPIYYTFDATTVLATLAAVALAGVLTPREGSAYLKVAAIQVPQVQVLFEGAGISFTVDEEPQEGTRISIPSHQWQDEATVVRSCL